jgi:hypothetical protein
MPNVAKTDYLRPPRTWVLAWCQFHGISPEEYKQNGEIQAQCRHDWHLWVAYGAVTSARQEKEDDQ